MAQYDGSIRINTKIDSKEASAQLMTLENRIVKTADKVASLRSKMDALKNAKIPTEEYQNLQKGLKVAENELEKLASQDTKLASIDQKIKDLAKSSAEYAEKMKEVSQQKIPTKEYMDAQKQADALEKKLLSLYDRQEKFLETGGKEGSTAYKRMAYDAEALEMKLRQAEQDAQAIVDAGKAFTLGADTGQYQNLSDKQAAVNQEIEKQKALYDDIVAKQSAASDKVDEIKTKIQQLTAEGKDFSFGGDTEEFSKLAQQLGYAEMDLAALNRRHDQLSEKQEKNKRDYKKLGDTAKKSFDKINRSAEKANKTAKKSGGLISTMVSRFKGLALSLLIFNQISKAFNAMISGIKEGMGNLAQYSNDTNAALSSLMSGSTYLKNALATAFSPIVEVITPILVRFIDLLGEVTTKVSEFFSALMGKKTFTKAIKVQQDYADSLRDTSNNTKKAAEETKKAIAPFDDLRQIQFQDAKEQEDLEMGKDKDVLSPEQMFETADVSEKMNSMAYAFRSMADTIKKKAGELKDIFSHGFWDALGDYKPILSGLISDLSNIGGYLKDIFTDKDVMAAASRFVNSFVYAVGTFAGMLASIGLTIAANIVGGIESYLSRNVERIKEWLVRMFDIGTEINTIFSNFFIAFADVFSVFASDTAQEITGYIIQIFADIFGGILELTLKFFRDVSDMMLTPFVENKDKIKTAIEETLEPIKTVVEAIAETVRHAVDKIVELYDDHIHPFFESIKEGLSELLGKLLDAYTTYIVPVLDNVAKKFKEVMEGPVGDAIDSAIGFIGNLVDALKQLWDDVLVPLIGWIIDNIIPVLAPILEGLLTVSLDVFGGIAEVVGAFFDQLSGLLDFVVGVLSGDWGKAWNGMKVASEAAGKVVKSIIDTISKAIQGLIDTIGKAMDAIRNLGSAGKDAQKTSGYRSGTISHSRATSVQYLDVSYPPIPRLASGTVVPPNREFLATLGDNKREPEVVSPISTMKQAFIEALRESGINFGGGSSGPVYLQLDGKTFARLINPYTEEEKTRVGVRMVTGSV